MNCIGLFQLFATHDDGFILIFVDSRYIGCFKSRHYQEKKFLHLVQNTRSHLMTKVL